MVVVGRLLSSLPTATDQRPTTVNVYALFSFSTAALEDMTSRLQILPVVAATEGGPDGVTAGLISWTRDDSSSTRLVRCLLYLIATSYAVIRPVNDLSKCYIVFDIRESENQLKAPSFPPVSY